jgi:hypothetical protein
MTRYYKHNGLEKPSVTTITGVLDKPGLVYWSAGCVADYIIEYVDNELKVQAEKNKWFVPVDNLLSAVEKSRKEFRNVSKKAMGIGSQTHDAIEQYLKTGNEPYNPPDQVLAAFLAFLEWKDENNLQVIETEKTVYADNYAGTEDLKCLLNGSIYVIDFKTSKLPKSGKPYDEHKLQVAAYRQCEPDAVGCGVLYLDKETGLPLWCDTSDDYERDRKAFNSLCEFYWNYKAPKKLLKQWEKAA